MARHGELGWISTEFGLDASILAPFVGPAGTRGALRLCGEVLNSPLPSMEMFNPR